MMLYVGVLFMLFPIILSESYPKNPEIIGNEIDTDFAIVDKLNNSNILKDAVKRIDSEKEVREETSTIKGSIINTSTEGKLEALSNYETEDEKSVSTKISDENIMDKTEIFDERSDDEDLFDLVGDTVISSLKFIWRKVKKIFHWAWSGTSWFGL
ncbi:unnamed protein product [Nezara viridula]|uniref:Neuropeptide n=1 Tax=Nezara viridula TaxID=85310 RepID=A0A9P0DXS0_NEZVI|nr:unnamed protein product [Nezara viridula]